MADVSSPTVATQPGPYQKHAYNKSAHFAPMASGTHTPINVSPTSPRTLTHLPTHPNHAPPIRPLKTPNYVPAALRKTEKPNKQSPPKVDSAIDSPNSSWGTGASFGQGARIDTTISRIATEDLNSIYNDAPLSPVTGPITRNHWQSDSSTPVCSASTCQQPFGFFVRRHHCRKCGGIFCWQHSQKQVKLNEHALFHPEGDFQRACDKCYHQFKEWEVMRTSRQNSESSDSSSNRNTPAVQIETPKRPDTTRIQSVANSVGGAWNWSTF